MLQLDVNEDSVVLVRLRASSSPAAFEDAIRKAAPALVGSLLSWAGGDWFAVAQDAIPMLDGSDGMAMVDMVKVVDAAGFAAIASLRDSQAGASSFDLRDRGVQAAGPVMVEPPEFSWDGQYQGSPIKIDWHVASIGLPLAWQALGAAGPSAYANIKVGHIDTGYTEHPALGFGSTSGTWIRPDLGCNLWSDKLDTPAAGESSDRWYSIPEFAGPQDNLTGAFGGHGTRTSTVLCGLFAPSEVEIEYPFFGAAPGASIIPYRITDSVIIDHVPDLLAEAITDAVNKGAEVISISLGALRPDKRVAKAVQHAYQQGVIVCAAAGQVFRGVIYPGRFNCVITVGGATTMDGRSFHPWRVAARGPDVDICGPADQIRRPTTVMSGGGTKFLISGPGDGTSFATALCAGIAVLWLARRSTELNSLYGNARWARVEAFRRLLTSTAAVPDGWPTDTYGAGVYQADALMAAALPSLVELEERFD